MDTTTNLTPQQIGSYWAVPTIDSTENSQVEIQLSIAVSGEDSLKGSDVTVKAMSNATALAQLSGPDASAALSTVEARSMTAFAIFTFDNPQNLALTSIVVSIADQSATFDSSLPVA